MKTIQALPSVALIFLVLFSVNLVSLVYGGCRDQERVECETVCHWNASSGQHNCNLRAVLILPSNLSYEASLTKVSFFSLDRNDFIIFGVAGSASF